MRDPARVLDDVRNGKVSVQAAERDYGVRVSGPPWCVEEPATRELRAARASSPGHRTRAAAMSDARSGRTRVGVDIGGTFTDLVARGRGADSPESSLPGESSR